MRAGGAGVSHGTNRSSTPALDLTVEQALGKGARFLDELGIDAARLEIELIVAEALGLDRLGLYMDMKRPLIRGEREQTRQMLARRREREPLAYILGRREFFGLQFAVTRDVLIPRPETEMIVELALKWMEARARGSESPSTIAADIGTGSGAIAVACAVMQAKRSDPGRWIATDASEPAIEVARGNAITHGVSEQIELRQGDLYAPLEGPVDCLCSNPPYIPADDLGELQPEVSRFEPSSALVSGPRGLDHLERLILGAAEWLNSGGVLFFEFGYGQKDEVQSLAEQADGLTEIRIHNDLAGIPRVLEAHRGQK